MPTSKWNLVCVAAATMICTGAMAASQSSVAAKAPAAGGASAPFSVMFQGVQVSIDPATGRLREPTAAERAALTQTMLHEQALQSVAPRQPGQRPRTAAEAQATLRHGRSGSKVGMLMQVPESQMNYLSAEKRADGSLNIHHQDEGNVSHAAPAAAQEVTQ